VRHRLAILVAASTMALGGALAIGVLPAAAADNCPNWNTCSWTQINNGNWQPNANMNPDCGSSCAQWTQDCSYRLAYYNSWIGSNSIFEHDTDWAVNTWNAVPECSPSYVKSGSNDSSVSIVYDAATFSGSMQYWCGNTVSTGTPWNGIWVISHMEVQLNTNDTYYDGPVPSNAPPHSCNLKSALLHETGHTLGEGHSSVQSDVMYPNNNNATAIDADAHHMLAAIYGTASPSGCSSCQFDVLGLNWGAPPVHQMGPNAFEQALNNKEQGVRNSVSSAEAGEGSTIDNAKQVVLCAGEAIGGNACG
jgi:hypothetical protein